METIICWVGGAARGNPGLASIGVFVASADGVMIEEVAQGIGNATDNFATYYAVMVGLQTLQSLYGEKTLAMQFEVRLDNEFVQKQLSNETPITDPGSVPLFIEIHNMQVAHFPTLSFQLVVRTDNNDVYRLVEEALDGKR